MLPKNRRAQETELHQTEAKMAIILGEVDVMCLQADQTQTLSRTCFSL